MGAGRWQLAHREVDELSVRMQLTDHWVPSEEVDAVAGLPALPLFKDWEPVEIQNLRGLSTPIPL